MSHISWVIANFSSNFVAMASRVGRGKICPTSFNSPTPKTPWSMQESWTYLSYKLSYNQFWPKFRCHGRCKNLGHISHISRVITNFDPNFVAMATRVGRGKIWLTSLNSQTPKTPVRRKNLGDISHISRVVANFSSNFVAMATRVGRGSTCCHRSIGRPRKNPVERKDLGDIFHTGRVIAYFLSNFVAMATRVGRGRIWLTSLNSPTPKTPC